MTYKKIIWILVILSSFAIVQGAMPEGWKDSVKIGDREVLQMPNYYIDAPYESKGNEPIIINFNTSVGNVVRFVVGNKDEFDVYNVEWWNPKEMTGYYVYSCENKTFEYNNSHYRCTDENSTILKQGRHKGYLGNSSVNLSFTYTQEWEAIPKNFRKTYEQFDNKTHWKASDTFAVLPNRDYKIKLSVKNYLKPGERAKYDFFFVQDGYNNVLDAIADGKAWGIDPFSLGVSNLTSYYTFDGNGCDDVHSSYDCVTITGATNGSQYGKNNAGYYFDGINDRILMNETPLIQSVGSISFWANYSDTTAKELISYDNGASTYSIRVGWNGGAGNCYAQIGANFLGYSGAGTCSSSGSYQHYVMAWDGSYHTFYINGVLEINDSDAGGVADTTSFWLMYSYGNGYTGGTIDEIGIWDTALNYAQVNELYASGTGLFYNEFIDPDTDEINITNNGAVGINSSGDSITGFNTTNLQQIELVKLNLTIDSSSDVDTIYINYTMNGSSSCALGNLQHSTCYNYTGANQWIKVQNNTVTSTFNQPNGLQGDKFNFTRNGNSTSFDLISFIDEHYQNIYYKAYPLNGTDVKWQSGANQRITGDNYLRIEIDPDLLATTDIYKLDFRVDYSANTPTEPLTVIACNSTINSLNVSPLTYAGCDAVAQKTPSELQDDGTKFRDLFANSFITNIGDFKYVYLTHNENSASKYYYIKTLDRLNASDSTNWLYSNDAGSTFSDLADGYSSELNINGFATNTQFIYNVWVNNSNGSTANQQYSIDWDIDATLNIPPIPVINTPLNNVSLTLPYNITFSLSDTNNNNLNGTLYLLYTNGTQHSILATNMNQSNSSYYWDDNITGSFDLILEAKELGTTDLYSVNATHRIHINTPPIMTKPVITPAIITRYRNLTATATFTDPDGDSGNITWVLYVNDVANTTIINTSITNGSSVAVTFDQAIWQSVPIGTTLKVGATGNDNISSGVENISDTESIIASCYASGTTDYICGDSIAQSCNLEGSITTSEHCLIANAHNIVIDGGGYTLTSTGTTKVGINIISPLDNVTIKNFVLNDWRYGIFTGFAENWTIYNNTLDNISLNAIDVAGNNNNISNNIITNSNEGIELNNGASYNIFKSNTITGGTTGFSLEGTGNPMYNNLIDSCVITDNVNNIILDSSLVNTLANVTIILDTNFSNGTSYDLKTSGNSGVNWARIVNGTFNDSNIFSKTSGGDNRLYIEWYVNALVKDTFGNPVNGSTVKHVPLGISSTVTTDTTNTTGFTPLRNITQKYITYNATQNYNNYRYNATYLSYTPVQREINITSNQVISLNLTNYLYNQTQNSTVYESETPEFELIVFNANGDVNATLTINNTAQTVVETISGFTYTYHVNYTVPLVSINATNHSWVWNWTYSNSTGGVSENTSTGNLTIYQAYNPLTFTLDDSQIIETQYANFTYNSTRKVDYATTELIIQRNATNQTFSLTNSGLFSSVDNAFSPGLNLADNEENYTYEAFLNVTFNGDTLIRTITNLTQNSYKMVLLTCGGASNTTTLNYTFVDAVTGDPVNLTTLSGATITAYKRTDTLNRQYSFNFAGVNSYEICLLPTWGNYSVDYVLTARATNYSTLTTSSTGLIISNTSQTIQTGLLESGSASAVNIHVLDFDDDPYVGYNVFAYLLDPLNLTTPYTLVGSDTTDFTGTVVFNLDVVDKKYKFNVTDLNGDLAYETDAFKISVTDYYFRISDAPTSDFDVLIDLNGLTYDLSVSGQTFTFTYSDGVPVGSSYCLRVLNTTLGGFTQLLYNCTTDNSSTMTYTVPSTAGQSYLASATLLSVATGNWFLLDQEDINNQSNSPMGTDGLLIAFIVVGTSFFLGLWKPAVGIVLGSSALALLGLIGIISFSTWTVWGGLAVMGVIVMMVVNR